MLELFNGLKDGIKLAIVGIVLAAFIGGGIYVWYRWESFKEGLRTEGRAQGEVIGFQKCQADAKARQKASHKQVPEYPPSETPGYGCRWLGLGCPK